VCGDATTARRQTMATDSVFLYNLATALSIVLNVLFWALVVRTGLRLTNMSVGPRTADVLTMLTTPVLAPFQKYLPHVGGKDLSPLFAGAALQLVQRLVLV
jgi:YggT family protein